MEFYEVMFLADGSTDAKEIEVRATGAAERCDDHFTVVSATIHARPNQFDAELGRHTAVAMVMVPGTWDDPRFDEFAGKMARLYGVPLLGATHLEDETLNFKSDEEAIESFKADALGDGPDETFEVEFGEARAESDDADGTDPVEENFSVEVTTDSDIDNDRQ